MFGHIMINKGDLKIREFEVYQSFYCGLCRKLKERYGFSGQLTLNYDLTFLVILLTGLYEPHNRRGTTHCAVHPFKKQPVVVNKYTDYAADMNILLSYYKCLDDWNDEKKADKLFYARLLKGGFEGLKSLYPKKAEKIRKLLEELSENEKQDVCDLDLMSGLFGKIMAEVLAYREDEWEDNLRKVGFYLGKFIYLCDAYEDLEEDLRLGTYNPLKCMRDREDFDKLCEQLLTMMAAECSREFEKLPVIQYLPILRNILYSGIWTRFEKAREKRKENAEGKQTRKRR